MNVTRIVKGFDAWQQAHPAVGFVLAVIKKYGEDSGGYQAALLTYYGFLSLFPLLLVLVTVLQIWFHNDPAFQHEVSTSIGHFIPVLGTQLEDQIRGIRGAGFGLVVGILFALYGARGGADAFRFAIDNMWQIPKNKRAGFPKSILHSLAIMAAGAGGFGATLAVSTFTGSLGHAQWVKIVANILGVGILTLVLGYAFRIATAGRLRLRYMLLGASIAAVLMQLLLSFGSILVAHELHNFKNVYGTFAVVLGMLFWIYFLAQVVLYAAEIDTVRHFHLYPRSVSGQLQTDADRSAYKLYAKAELYVPNETIKTKFKKL